MQTWEYSPSYALRTYAYLLPMATIATVLQLALGVLPSYLVEWMSSSLLPWAAIANASSGGEMGMTSSYHHVNDDKPLLFALLRSSLSLLSSLSELRLLDAIHDSDGYGLGINASHMTAFASLTSSGMHHSNASYLPSSTVMMLWRMSAADQLRKKYGRAIFWGLLSTLSVGWPFCSAMFVSTGIVAMWDAAFGHDENGGMEAEKRRNGCDDDGARRWRCRCLGRTARFDAVAFVLVRTILHALLIQYIVSLVDYAHYGRVVFPTWNIFAYNAKMGGDDFYGVEPTSYYVRNLLLNFNYVAILGIISLPLIAISRMIIASSSSSTHDGRELNGGAVGPWGGALSILVPMYVWLIVVVPRPHKEERFLFPIYPIICLGAAMTIGEVLLLYRVALSCWRSTRGVTIRDVVGSRGRNDDRSSLLVGLALLVPSAMISVSRSAAVCRNYSAPLAVYRDLYYHVSASVSSSSSSNDGRKKVYVCTAGEWHRFPSSFFLPPNHALGYLRSSFGGQLPQPFTEYGSRMESLSVQSGEFNDVNREEMDRYVDIEQCSYVVELVPSLDQLDNDYSGRRDVPESTRYMRLDNSGGSWMLLSSRDYLDAESTPSIHRILYIPFFGASDEIIFGGYNLYMKKV